MFTITPKNDESARAVGDLQWEVAILCSSKEEADQIVADHKNMKKARQALKKQKGKRQ